MSENPLFTEKDVRLVRDRADWWRIRAEMVREAGGVKEEVDHWLARAAEMDDLADRLARSAGAAPQQRGEKP